MLKVLGEIKQRAKFQHRISMDHAVMLSIICAQNGFLGGFEGEDVKILSSDPQKALHCVNTRLLMYRLSKSVQRPELSVGRKNFAYEERN